MSQIDELTRRVEALERIALLAVLVMGVKDVDPDSPRAVQNSARQGRESLLREVRSYISEAIPAPEITLNPTVYPTLVAALQFLQGDETTQGPA